MGTQWTIRTICGSMRYMQGMLEVANKQTADGVIILMPFVAFIKPEDQENNPLKQMLDEMHLAKIDMSDGIIVVAHNDDPEMHNGHIGKSTEREIEHAKATGKEVLYWTRHFWSIPHLPRTPSHE